MCGETEGTCCLPPVSAYELDESRPRHGLWQKNACKLLLFNPLLRDPDGWNVSEPGGVRVSKTEGFFFLLVLGSNDRRSPHVHEKSDDPYQMGEPGLHEMNGLPAGHSCYCRKLVLSQSESVNGGPGQQHQPPELSYPTDCPSCPPISCGSLLLLAPLLSQSVYADGCHGELRDLSHQVS